MSIPHQICFEKFLRRLLAMKAHGVIRNVFRFEIVVCVKQIIPGFRQPLSCELDLFGHTRSSLLVIRTIRKRQETSYLFRFPREYMRHASGSLLIFGPADRRGAYCFLMPADCDPSFKKSFISFCLGEIFLGKHLHSLWRKTPK